MGQFLDWRATKKFDAALTYCLRTILNDNANISAPTFTAMNICHFNDLVFIQNVLSVFKSLGEAGKTQHIFKSLASAHDTRAAMGHKLTLPVMRTKADDQCYLFTAPKHWNMLPHVLTASKTLLFSMVE